MSHTPGPWEWVGTDIWAGGGVEVVGCSVSCGSYCQGGRVSMEVKPEDADLIAAAPDLLEALRPFAEMECCDDGIRPESHEHPERCLSLQRLLAARAAIAKAEGK